MIVFGGVVAIQSKFVRFFSDLGKNVMQILLFRFRLSLKQKVPGDMARVGCSLAATGVGSIF